MPSGGLCGYMRSMDLGDSPICLIPTPPPSLWRERKKEKDQQKAAALSQPLLPGGVAPASILQQQNPQQGWEWKTFANPARTDGLELRHWQRKGMNQEEYPFAKFNKKAAILKYNEEEYARYLTVSDWTKQETDELFKLAERFDLNFIVVSDRWNLSTPRSIDALKDRFYFCQRKIAELRNLCGEGEDGVLMTHPYNMEWETQRKLGMEKLFTRPKAEMKSELVILEQARKIDQNRKKKPQPDVKKKKGEVEEDVAVCAPGSVSLRSSILTKSAERQNALKWLAGAGIYIHLSSQHTQAAFVQLCNDVINLMDWQKKVSKKKKDRESLFDKKQDLLRPLKKRKTAPSQRLQDGQAVASNVAGSAGGTPVPSGKGNRK
uniref:dAMP1 SANT/Myb-like domain-containing protein n=1 Tax=Hanusia phi TaxID=3032 RepID=A0A7S0I0Q2_9CRYP|mmetsp:Transcript_7639/g.17423  ORF Transcript_7639/g.17423 Transcript_7639/m.17423 type:complete len:377 (+) Transcript_7639:60-1190(+)